MVTAPPAAAAADKADTIWTLATKAVEILPALFWPLLILGVLIWRRRDIDRVVQNLTRRVEAGAPINIAGALEIGAHSGRTVNVQGVGGQFFVDKSREPMREAFYKRCRRIVVVHTLHASSEPGQVFDILLYLHQHGPGSLLEVTKVEYYFGRMWEHLVATTDTRANSFAARISAYGSFLCMARIHFTDGAHCDQFRYVDFEAPPYPPLNVVKPEASSPP